MPFSYNTLVCINPDTKRSSCLVLLFHLKRICGQKSMKGEKFMFNKSKCDQIQILCQSTGNIVNWQNGKLAKW